MAFLAFITGTGHTSPKALILSTVISSLGYYYFIAGSAYYLRRYTGVYTACVKLFVKAFSQITGLKAHMGARDVEEFNAVKLRNKERLSQYILAREGVELPPHFVFDVQVKRMHEYKRQLLNAFSLMDIYFRLKEGSLEGITPMAAIFGAKAAPGYWRAKGIIKYIQDVAALINNDPDMRDLLRVVFVSNYNCSYAEQIIPAADISEQISPAGTEASGTGNMKFMMNGAVTCGTLDGANIEMLEQTGRENIYIFGVNAEQVEGIYAHNSYRAGELYEGDVRIRRLMEQLIDGTLCPEHPRMFADIYQSLLFGSGGQMADSYLVLKDFESFRQTQEQIGRDYTDHYKWQRMAANNTASAGYFSSDRTILEYNERIWHLRPVL